MTTTEIPTNLIEKALALTGKTMEDMFIGKYRVSDEVYSIGVFSIEKFTYFLLSPSFIEKYAELLHGKYKGRYSESYSMHFGLAIYEYQKGNPDPLIELLKKI